MKSQDMFAVLLACLFTAPAWAQDLPAFVGAEVANLVETYKGLHAHPELSHHEEHTSALLAGELRKAGYTVTERIGKYPDGTQAYGLVAILENGPGPRLLIWMHCPSSRKPASAMRARSRRRMRAARRLA
jgi:hypothetical protein